MKTIGRQRTWIFGAVFLFGVPAAAFFGGGFRTGSYMGPLPSTYYAGEPCFPATISSYTEDGLTEVMINPRGVASDNDPKTYLRCSDIANTSRIICHAGFPDGTVATCSDTISPRTLPSLDDRVYMVLDLAATGSDTCDIVIESSFGEANPACRASGTGGTSGTGGSPPTGSCNASTAAATLSTGQSTTIASNACVRLKIDPTWSSVDPIIQAQPGTSSYPVPFTATSCKGNSSGSLTGDWNQNYLVDGPGATANYNCDVFVQLQGSGSAVKFVYYD